MANITVMSERELDEYARLYQLDGRVSAVQNYVDNENDYIDVNIVLSILNIDMSKFKSNVTRKYTKGEKE